MALPALATANPPRLLNSVGPQGRNEVQDVALVQALLRAKNARGGRPFLASRVTGRFDRETAEALARFFADQRPGPLNRPPDRQAARQCLKAGTVDSNLAILARGQSIAVLKGTATPYDYQHRAAPGRICGPLADQLPSDRRPALERLLRELSADYGICFDAQVKPAAQQGRRRDRPAGATAVAPMEPRSRAACHDRRTTAAPAGPARLSGDRRRP